MNRSYLKIKPHDFEIYFNPKLMQADAIIIDVFDASIIFTNFEKYKNIFTSYKQAKIKIYLYLDLYQLKKSYKAIDQTIGEFIDGFYLTNPTKSQLNSISLKSRDYEVKQKLVFKSLEFIIAINNVNRFEEVKKTIKSNRVNYLICEDIDSIYSHQAVKIAKTYHKVIVNPNQFTSDINQLQKINNEFTIASENINYSLSIINNYNLSSKKEKRLLIKQDDIYYHYQILQMANRLGLIDDYPHLNFFVNKKKVKLLKRPIKIKKFYTLGEEIANSVTHGAGIMLAIIAIILLMIKGGNTLEIIAYLVFGISAVILYTTSTLYHAFTLGNQTKLLFQKFDHMTIYLLIAGTYTPFSLITVGGKTGIYLCIFLWVGSLSGLLLNLFAFGKFRWLHMLLYVSLGWVAILFLPEITLNLSLGGVVLLIIGGIMYTLGILFYALRLFKFTHMVWHIFTVLGTLAHFLAILLYV